MEIKNIHEHAGWFASYMNATDGGRDAQGEALVKCQMKKLLLIALLLPVVVVSCVRHIKYEKPFIIIEKSINHVEAGKCYYEYQDKNGNQNSFSENNTKYNIGDTIK